MKRRIAVLLLLLILLLPHAPSAFLAQQNVCITQAAALSVAQDSLGSIAVALLALLVSFNVVAVGYIISKIVPGTKIGDWVRSEFWEIAKSGMLIVIIYAVIIFVGNVSTLIAPVELTSVANIGVPNPNGLGTLVNSACSYLTTEQSYIGGSFNYLFGLSGALGVLKNMQFGLYFPIPPIPIPFIPIVFEFGFMANVYKNGMLATAGAPWASVLSDMINLVAVPVGILIAMQLNALPLLFALGLGVLIPIGLIFRAFPFVRGIGGSIVAIGIGISLIYPSVLILFNWPITAAIQGSAIPSPGVGPGCGSALICGLAGVAFAIVQNLQGYADAIAALTTITPALNSILIYGTYILLQFVLFILDLAISVSLSESIANTLGGTIRLELGGKLKLK